MSVFPILTFKQNLCVWRLPLSNVPLFSAWTVVCQPHWLWHRLQWQEVKVKPCHSVKCQWNFTFYLAWCHQTPLIWFDVFSDTLLSSRLFSSLLTCWHAVRIHTKTDWFCSALGKLTATKHEYRCVVKADPNTYRGYWWNRKLWALVQYLNLSAWREVMLWQSSREETWELSSRFYILFFHISTVSSVSSSIPLSPTEVWSLSLCAAPQQIWWSDVGMGKLSCGLAEWELWPPASPFLLLPPPSLSFGMAIRTKWKAFLCAFCGKPEISWALRQLLGLLQGTGSSQTGEMLCTSREGWKICFCICSNSIVVLTVQNLVLMLQFHWFPFWTQFIQMSTSAQLLIISLNCCFLKMEWLSNI